MITGMAKDFENMGIYFVLKGVDYTVHGGWSHGRHEMAMKTKLRKGGYGALNLYYVHSLRSSPDFPTTGKCNFPDPSYYGQGGEILTRDGCTIRRDLLSHGQTTTHEVGHWLGLLHTFHGGCTGRGDLIDDTPACKETYGCDENADTCPESPGKDDVHNFMGYNTCRTGFTVGQTKRARRQYHYWRSQDS